MEDDLIERQKSGETVRALRDKPILKWGAGRYLRAFSELDRRRQFGYSSTQPLTVECIIAYGKAFGFRHDLQFFFRAMSRLDDEYLKKQAEEAKRRQAKSKRGSK